MMSVYWSRLITVSLIAVISACELLAQGSQSADPCAITLPSNLTLDEPAPQTYRLTTIWYNRDVHGKATGKYIISGVYTRGLPGDTVRWNNIEIEVFGGPMQEHSDTLMFPALEGLSYRSPDDLISPGLFAAFPADESQHLLKTLVWDAIAFEAFSWNYFDQLKLNQPIRAADLEGTAIDMAGWGTIKMQNLELTWTGVTELNGRKCATITYQSFVNPVKSNPFSSQANGRSLYWGSLYVSLLDKQIEFATMNEDIVMEIKSNPEFGVRTINIQREVRFERN
jgi:hypothetical protein